MEELRWTLRIRRNGDWDDHARPVRCFLIPVRQKKQQDGSMLEVLALDALVGIEEIRLPEVFREPKWMGFVRKPKEQGKEGSLEVELRTGETALRPFHIEGLLNAEQREESERAIEADLRERETTQARRNRFAWVLDRFYRSRRSLDALVRATPNDEPSDTVSDPEYSGPLAMAASSALVFDAMLRATKVGDSIPLSVVLEADGDPLEPAPRATVEHDALESEQAPRVRSLRAEQYVHGVTFRVELQPDESKAAVDGEHDVRVERWIGAPVGQPDHTTQRRLPELKKDPRAEAGDFFHALDVLEPEELVGQQLHYRVQLLNQHGRVTHVAAGSLLRQRKDAPPGPASTSIHVSMDATFEPTRVRLEISLPGFPDDDPRYLGIALFAEDRPLDACGFYGGADDLALLNGLGALDLTPPGGARPSADGDDEGSVPEHPLDLVARARLQGQWGATGLRPLAVRGLSDWEKWRIEDEPEPPNGDSGSAPRLVLDDLRLKDILPRRGHGRRFHLACFRVPREATKSGLPSEWREGAPPGDVMSPLASSIHTIGADDSDKKIPVFQVERVVTEPAPTFLSPENIGTRVDAPRMTDDAEEPEHASVYLQLRHPPVGPDDSFVVGGLRVWARDVIGSGDSSPYRHVTTLQSVPPLVASYRPVPLNAATRWALVPGDHSMTPELKALPKELKKLRESFTAFVTSLLELGFRFVTSRPQTHRDEEKASEETPRDDEEAFKRTPAAVMKTWFESFGERVEAQPELEGAWVKDETFPGALFSALTDLGLAEQLVLPLAQVQRVSAGEGVLQVLREALPQTGQAATFVCWLRDASGHPFATVALVHACLPPAKSLDTPAQEALQAACKEFFKGMNANHPIRVLELGALDPETRAFGDDRTFSYRGMTVTDGWRHEIDWKVQQIDRYAHARAMLSGRDLAPNRELACPTGADPYRFTTVIPRRKAVKDTIALTRDLSSGPGRLVFRYPDPPERRAASRNALDATRCGALRIVHDMDRELFGAAQYAEFLVKAPDRWDEDAPTTQPQFVEEFPAGAEPSRSTLMGSLDFGPVPPYYTHRLAARLTADEETGQSTEASGRVEPVRLQLPRRPKFESRVDPAKVRITLKLARLRDSHPPGYAESDSEAPKIGQLVANADQKFHPLQVRLLPDLEMAYRFHLNVGNASRIRLVSLFELFGSLSSSAQGHVPHGLPYHGFRVRSLSRWVRESNIKVPSSDANDLLIDLEVTLDAAPDDPEWQLVVQALSDEIDQKPAPYRFYFELLRQGRTAGPSPWKVGA